MGGWASPQSAGAGAPRRQPQGSPAALRRRARARPALTGVAAPPAKRTGIHVLNVWNLAMESTISTWNPHAPPGTPGRPPAALCWHRTPRPLRPPPPPPARRRPLPLPPAAHAAHAAACAGGRRRRIRRQRGPRRGGAGQSCRGAGWRGWGGRRTPPRRGPPPTPTPPPRPPPPAGLPPPAAGSGHAGRRVKPGRTESLGRAWRTKCALPSPCSARCLWAPS